MSQKSTKIAIQDVLSAYFITYSDLKKKHDKTTKPATIKCKNGFFPLISYNKSGKIIKNH
jgi:hypothetical protein